MNLQKKLNLAMGVLLLISLLSCSNLPEANQNWVIITRKQPERILIDSRLKESDGFWTPSANDIYKLEEGMAEYLNQNSRNFTSQPPAWERLDEYQRQYIGIERGGKQIIYGNFFCEEDDNWRKEFVMVIDGGDCYFQVEYDVESGKFIYLAVNGES